MSWHFFSPNYDERITLSNLPSDLLNWLSLRIEMFKRTIYWVTGRVFNIKKKTINGFKTYVVVLLLCQHIICY